MPGRVLVIGESLVDLIGAPDAEGDLVYRPRSGGSPLNVAVGLARLGVSTILATAVGGDSFGRGIRRFLDAEGVEVIDRPVSSRGTCLAIVTRVGGNVDFEYFGDTSAMLDIGPIDDQTLAGSAVVHAGSTAFMDDPVLGSVHRAFHLDGPFKTADPNPRPFLIPDRDRYLHRMEEVVAMADLVKLSAEDVDYLYPGQSSEAVSDHLLALGPRVVIITRAEQDTAVATAGGFAWVPVPATDLVDPTGAGDSFTASLLRDVCGQDAPVDLEGWSRLAWRADIAASLACASVGGAEAMPSAEILDRHIMANKRANDGIS